MPSRANSLATTGFMPAMKLSARPVSPPRRRFESLWDVSCDRRAPMVERKRVVISGEAYQEHCAHGPRFVMFRTVSLRSSRPCARPDSLPLRWPSFELCSVLAN